MLPGKKPEKPKGIHKGADGLPNKDNVVAFGPFYKQEEEIWEKSLRKQAREELGQAQRLMQGLPLGAEREIGNHTYRVTKNGIFRVHN